MTPNPEQSERLFALAARCEAAEGPNFALEMEIGRAVAPNFKEMWDSTIGYPAPAYTASLDAAITLVPEGHEWLRWGPGTMIVMLPPQPGDTEKSWARHIECRGATPALALTAACLRARARAGDGA